MFPYAFYGVNHNIWFTPAHVLNVYQKKRILKIIVFDI